MLRPEDRRAIAVERSFCVRLWLRNGATYQHLLSFRSLPGTVKGLWLSADGGRLGMLLQGESAVRLWDLAWLRERCEELGIGW